MSLLLQDHYPMLAEEMIFVAGHRVVTDPFAIPFSMGRNLLCIFSKKHIDNPPEKKHSKQIHNKRTMQKMSELLSEGGHSIYVAPSGGRDRMEKNGEIKVAPFDPSSIEMFYLMARRSKKPAHFYPLALSTYDILPPPETTEKELGEVRVTKGGAIHISCLDELNMEKFPGSDHPEKHMRRKLRADYIYNLVCEEYKRIT